MGFLEVLTVVFVVLKLIHVIDWSWWLVFAPLWAGYGAGLIIAALFTGIAAILGGRY